LQKTTGIFDKKLSMQVPGNWFRDWFNSPYYHLLYHYRDETEAAAFLEKLIAYLRPASGDTMLDVACGRGRHARILETKGFDVTGIDIAPDSIEYAKQFERERLHFYVHDMRLPFWINYFNHAFNFFTSFGYFRTEREHYDAMRTIANSIREGGNFVIDYFNAEYAEAHLVPESKSEAGGVLFNMTRWADHDYLYKKIHVDDSTLGHTAEFTERIKKLSTEDFDKMFTRYGLQIRDVFGDYALSPYDKKTSQRLILAAKKI